MTVTQLRPDVDVDATAGRPLEWLEAELLTLSGHIAAATCRFLVLVAEYRPARGLDDLGVPECRALARLEVRHEQAHRAATTCGSPGRSRTCP